MTTLSALEDYLDRLLLPKNFSDAALNGVQVACERDITKIATGVTASSALIHRAAEQGAQLVLAHHGLFWKGQSPAIRGFMYQRIRVLVEKEIALVAYHLPLDAHPEVGNNALLAEKIGLSETHSWGSYKGMTIGIGGRMSSVPMIQVLQAITDAVGKPPCHFPGGPERIERVAIVSGGAASMALDAARDGFQLYLTGEPSESCLHLAAEEKMHIVAAGHHATETWGVKNLGERVASHFGIESIHLDIPNPV